MNAPVPITRNEQHLWLSPQRSIFWEEKKALILSDMHLGKSGHFRKSGIAVPQKLFKEDLHRLVDLLQQFNPSQLIVVGDMFHSDSNKELDLFCKWRNDFPELHITLVRGNHDILKENWYHEAGITVQPGIWDSTPFRFVHDPAFTTGENTSEDLYSFSGHLHPGVLLSGAGKQSLRLPCFHFGKSHCTLPAFGAFTGLALITPESGDNIYAIVEKSLIQIV